MTLNVRLHAGGRAEWVAGFRGCENDRRGDTSSEVHCESLAWRCEGVHRRLRPGSPNAGEHPVDRQDPERPAEPGLEVEGHRHLEQVARQAVAVRCHMEHRGLRAVVHMDPKEEHPDQVVRAGADRELELHMSSAAGPGVADPVRVPWVVDEHRVVQHAAQGQDLEEDPEEG